MDATLIFTVLILIFSIVIHEVSHGYAANALGDPTARLAGRLTLNPIKHIDPLGSVLLPGLLLITNAPILFGWAKPVPYNPYNLSNQRWGEALVAGAGPAVNLLLALIFGLLIRFSDTVGLPSEFVGLSTFVVYINILLALFNLIPVPPLDGSKVLGALLPFGLSQKMRDAENYAAQYGLITTFFFLILFIYVLAEPFYAILVLLSSLITGLSPGEFISLMRGI